MRRQFNVRLAIVAAGMFGLAFLPLGLAEDAPKHKYIGVSKCAKLCHKSKKQGNQLGLWQKTKHAEAYKTLLTDEAKATAKKLGVDAPEKSEKCLKCHATGYGVPAEFLKSTFKVEDGVQCESCHGPGEDYSDKKVMKDHDKAVSLGMIPGSEKACVKCHNDTSPTWKADRYTTKDGKKVGFDYEGMLPKILHPRPKAEAE